MTLFFLQEMGPAVHHSLARLLMAGVSYTGWRSAADFANASAGAKFVTAEGSWLSKPTAVLRAMDATNNMTSVLLSLAQPHYDAASRTLTFKARRPACLLLLHQTTLPD